MNIEIKHAPRSPTGITRGSVLAYDGSPQRLLVVGEDDAYLHTFIMDSGAYYGVFKAPDNLGCLVTHLTGPPEAA